mgnify:CR=1 FL=1
MVWPTKKPNKACLPALYSATLSAHFTEQPKTRVEVTGGVFPASSACGYVCGVKPSNARRFVDAGAHVMVAGSAVFGAQDRAAAIRAIRGEG